MCAKFLLVTLIVLLLAESARAACDQETIETLSPNGDFLILDSGKKYDVVPGDQATAAQWQESDDAVLWRIALKNSNWPI